MKKDKLIIGSRGSELALWQANYVKSEIEREQPSLKVEIKIITTKGDKILDVALSQIGSKGLFTKELETCLLNDECDIAVHSLKDLETKMPEGLLLGAVSKRHDCEDVLIARQKGDTIFDLKVGATVATGSLRRRSQLLHLRPDINVIDLRGNVPGRIKKFIESDWDAIILARAGVERLGLEEHISSVISFDYFLPAVGQGALGIQISERNTFALDVVGSIHDDKTYCSVLAERALLKALEGGCQAPIGALGIVEKNGLYLDAFVGSLDGSLLFRHRIRGSIKDPESLGKKLANLLLSAGANEVLDEIFSQHRNSDVNN